MNTVGEVAEIAGVTVRTLHHYDELGLLRPSERSEAGYRLYSHDDLARRREIVIWRHIADERFAHTYEREAERLATYVHDAIVANADAQETERVSR